MSDLGIHRPLLLTKRGIIPEITCYGAICWVHGTRVIHHWGEPAGYFLRSLAKPLQLKYFAAHALNEFSLEQKALALSSHNGEASQVAILQTMLPGADHGLLQLPASLPMGVSALTSQAPEPSPWFHPCSGNHAGVIAISRTRGWNPTSYREAQHPYHHESLAHLSTLAASCGGVQTIAGDGCGFPTPGYSLFAMARFYADLAERRDEDWIWQAMVSHPELIGGRDRLDTEILRSARGDIIAKEGADGLLALATKRADYPRGLGVVIKLAHGRDERSMWLIAAHILQALGYTLSPLPHALAGALPSIVGAEILPPAFR